MSQIQLILLNLKNQLSLGIFELFGSKAFTKIFFENFRARLALHKRRQSFRGLLIKPKNKSAQIAPKMKSYYKYHIWGFQKCKNYQNIPTGSVSNGLQIRIFMPNKRGLAKYLKRLTFKANRPTSGWNILIIFAFLESSYTI